MKADVQPVGETGGLPGREKWIAGLLLFAAFVLRCFYIFRYRYDSDEPQHLHTTWGWTQGLLQYRDFFDNHTPLFHILLSPLVAALGERANILDFMRFAMVPLWFVSLWCVGKIGGGIFSRRAGLWAAVLISLLPWWFYPSIEYRTDNLWTPLWLSAVATLVCGTFTKWRAFFGGLLLGLCATVSLKTSLLCAVLAMAVFFTLCLGAKRLGWRGILDILGTAWPVVLGMLVGPVAVAAYFMMQGALGPFLYGTVYHNLLAKVDEHNHPAYLRLVFPVALPFVLYAGGWILRRSAETPRGLRQAGLFLFTALYYTALYSFWTLLTRQDYLPFYPLAAVLLAPVLIFAAERYLPARPPAMLAAVGALEIILVLAGRKPWENGTLREREILSEVLTLTRPGEYVMDFKGESVFRQRAYYWVTEPLTFYRLRHKMMEDTVARDLVAKSVCVVLNQDRWYPKQGAKFIDENYLAVGRTRVPGKVIAPKSAAAGEAISFNVAVPASYVVWADGKPVAGTLDGSPAAGPREMTAGPHTFTPDASHKRLAIFWTRAAERGFQPNFDKHSWQDFR